MPFFTNLRILCFILIYIFQYSVIAENDLFSITKWLNEIHVAGYDKLMAPGSLEKKSTDVQIEMYVEHIGSFRSNSMDYSMDIFFIEHWTDKRLMHNKSDLIIFSDKVQLDRLWMPDIYFSNSKTAQFNFVMVPNMNFRIWPNGTVRLGIRVGLKVACHMDLSSYPIDRQVCMLKIKTCATDTRIVNVTWANEEPVVLDPDIEPSDLELESAVAEMCSSIYYGFSYNCLMVKFTLKRSIEYSLLQTYLPTTFIVMISWISFWIDPASVPGRVALSVTTLLTLSTQAIAMHFHLPPVTYAKAQDFWFGLCLLFLFCALVEYAFVNMYLRKEQKIKSKFESKQESWPLIKKTTSSETNLSSHEEVTTMSKMKLAQKYRSIALGIDKYSRIVFPFCFILFCIAYWWYFIKSRFQVV